MLAHPATRRRAQPAAILVRAAAVLALAAIVGSAAVAAGAEQAGGKRKPVSFTVSEYAYKKLERAHKLLAEEQYEEASKVIEELARRRGLSRHERALIEQTRGYIASSQGRYAEAAAAFERCLKLEALPEGAQLNTRYNLAQLYLALERYDAAIETLKRWFAETENPGPAAYYLLAVAYAQAGRREQALEPARKAVEKAKEPKEAWLELLLALYLERKNYERARPLLEQLVLRFPKKRYWLQLSAVYAELGRERDALAAMQLAHEQKLLDGDSELRNLARMYLYHEIPYQAARVLERGLAEGRIKADAEAYELLADAWLSAREYDKAIEPLKRAARLSEDGKLFVRLGRLYMDREDWAKAIASFEQALAKTKLEDRGKTLVLLGIARLSAGERDKARAAFEQARSYDEASEDAERWLQHLERLEAQEQSKAPS